MMVLMAVHGSQVSQPESLVSLGSQAFVTSFSSFIAAALAVNVSLVSVLDYVLAPGAQLSATVATVPMVVEFSVSPPDSYSPGQVRLHLEMLAALLA